MKIFQNFCFNLNTSHIVVMKVSYLVRKKNTFSDITHEVWYVKNVSQMSVIFGHFLDVICKYLNLYGLYWNGFTFDIFILLHDVHK